MPRRIVVTGRVQGVSFRDATRAEAERLGVRGWVRNRGDGAVEALLDGPVEAVERLVAWAHEGPPSARVDGVEGDVCDEAAPSGFEVR